MGSSRIVREESGVWPVPAILQVFIYFRGRMAGVRRTEKGATEPGFSGHFICLRPTKRRISRNEAEKADEKLLLPLASLLHIERSAMNEEKKQHLYKVLVIGDYAVGKTSIIKRYCEGNLFFVRVVRFHSHNCPFKPTQATLLPTTRYVIVWFGCSQQHIL